MHATGDSELLGVAIGPPGLRIRPGWPGASRQASPAVAERGTATAVLPPHRLAFRAGEVAARVDALIPAGAAMRVMVRGDRGDDGGWTQWQPIERVVAIESGPRPVWGGQVAFADPVTSVQFQLLLRRGYRGASPVVRTVALTAWRGLSRVTQAAARAPVTLRVYATREGLVGAGTANGHVVSVHDHFVALPSRRSLDLPGSGDYTVRICAPQTGRCEYSPVWDVGPWNIRDDYWDPRPARQMWPSLPTGMPESQSAYLHGFNGGRDQFGRRVRNPAGVDIADGTMQRGLHLAGSAWVRLTLLWTGRYRHRVLVEFPWHGLVAVRTRPTWYSPKVGLAVSRTNVDVSCEARGQRVLGAHGRTNLWDQIGPRNWLPHAYVSGTLRRIAPCCRG